MYTPEVVGIMGEAVSCFELPIDVGIHQFFCTKSGGLNSTFSLSCIFHCVSFPFVQCRFKTCVCLLTPLSSSVVLFRVCFTFLLPSCSFAFCMPSAQLDVGRCVLFLLFFFRATGSVRRHPSPRQRSARLDFGALHPHWSALFICFTPSCL